MNMKMCIKETTEINLESNRRSSCFLTKMLPALIISMKNSVVVKIKNSNAVDRYAA